MKTLGLFLALPLALIALRPDQTVAGTLPPGFVEEAVGGAWNEAVGLAFDSNGRMYVWERGGRVWIVENGVRLSPPLVDISDEVGGWRDYGLLGFALHPNYAQNGYVYLLYVVDHHHLRYFGTPNYDPNANEYFQATIGRLTRYTARASDGLRSVDPNSRRVLVGESISTGFPIMHQSHGTGTLLFGTDGTLLASAGDGASYSAIDNGGSVGGTYTAQALAEGIIRPKEDVGAYRAQLVDSLSGRIIRVDPETGDGVPGNPFYDPNNSRSARSRAWSLGLRNPFRMTLRPGTGSHHRADANPGALYIGDVGWDTWEELNVATGPGKNFGWPAFEGLTTHTGYHNSNVSNQGAPNPLYGTGGCTQQYFYFRDLIRQDSLDPNPSFPNPCDSSQQVPGSIPRFVHTRPAIDWRHPTGPARTGTYDGNGNATVINVGASGSPVSGPQFGGECSVGGVWYVGDDFPSQYKNTYFHADFDAGWIRNFTFDQNNRPVSVRDFLTNGGGIVAVATHPAEGGLYYITWGNQVRKISHVPGGNRPPTAVASADKTYGPSPLTIQFTGGSSTDPEGLPLGYRWDFGDGSPASTAANPSHTFQAPPGVPTQYTVNLTVTDNAGATAQTPLVISVNNTPPSVVITSPVDGSEYPMDGDTVYQLTASVTDGEHADSQLAYRWQTILHHNDHQHTEAMDTNHATPTVISPVGCDGNTYFYRITLTVTDPAGLSATNEVRLYPDCNGNPPPAEQFPAPWTHQDIGAVATAGNASYSGGTFTVSGSGADVWNNADEFHYVHQPLSGDGQIVVRVASQQNTDTWAKAGVMIREDLSAGSKYAMMAVAPGGLLFQFRSAAGGGTSFQLNRNGTTPHWIKLVRNGIVFTGYASPDGSAWTMIGSANVSLANSVFVGLAVTSHKDGTLCTATFENTSVVADGGTNPPAAPSGLTATPASATQINLAWTDQAGDEDGFEIERSTDNVAFTHIATGAANVTSYANTGLNNSTLYYYRVRAFNSGGRSPYSNTASATTGGSGGGLPAPWQNRDIGPVAIAGGTSESAGAFTVSGSGNDIWDTTDAFHFVHRPWTGDGEIIARVAGLQNTAAWAKAGVMFRERLEPDSPNALMFITPFNGVGLQSRALSGGDTTFTRGPGLTPPGWVKLVRIGNTLTGYASSDGAVWNVVGAHTVSMQATVLVGLAVTAHNNSALNTSTFTQVLVRAPQAMLMLGLGETNWTARPAVPRLSWMPEDTFGQLRLKIEDHPGQRYVLQHSADLVHWSLVATLENRAGVIFFVESNPLTHRQRHYRLLLVR